VATVEVPRQGSGGRSGTARREWFAPLDVEMVVVRRGPDLAVGRYAMIDRHPAERSQPSQADF
jgi:hypothetical protein